jgi:hypothetical protein
MGLERGPLGLVSTTEQLHKRKSSGSGLENREYGRGDLLSCPRHTLYPLKLALTLPTSGGRSFGIVRWQTKGHGVIFLTITLKVYEFPGLHTIHIELKYMYLIEASASY